MRAVSLTRHDLDGEARWAADGRLVPAGVTLGALLDLPAERLTAALSSLSLDDPARGQLLAPVDPDQEVWAAGVTYLKSRDARESESRSLGSSDLYARVYDAERPELFFKSPGWRVVPPGGAIRVRRDAAWSVPEPEMVVVVNRHLEVVGYCAGNDVSARDIEGDNPLYLSQAKIYDGACALGPAILLMDADALATLEVRLEIVRAGSVIFSGTTKTSEMKRSPQELVDYLGRELSFPRGALLMTGTSIVPSEDFTLREADDVVVGVGALELRNTVSEIALGGK